jgi:DNA-directed RNA polymerases I and III subunit RPAC2
MVRLSHLPRYGPCTERFTDNLSALQALVTALNDLDTLCETIGDAYDASLKKDNIERWDEKS